MNDDSEDDLDPADMPGLVDPPDDDDDMIARVSAAVSPTPGQKQSKRQRVLFKAAVAAAKKEEEPPGIAARRRELTDMRKGTAGGKNAYAPGTLVKLAADLGVSISDLQTNSGSQEALVALVLAHEKADILQAEYEKIKDSLDAPTREALLQRLVKPTSEALKAGLATDFVEAWHNACYCWGEMARTVAPSCFDMVCNHFFEILLPLGAEVDIHPGFAHLALAFVPVKVPVPHCMRLAELIKTEGFREAVPDHEDLDIYGCESSFASVGMMTFYKLPAEAGPLSKGALFTDNIYGRQFSGKLRSSNSNTTDRTLNDRWRDYWRDLGLRVPDRILFFNLDSQLMKHVKKYSSAERMREYAEKHAPVRGAVVYQEQGIDLIKGVTGYCLFPPDANREPVFFLSNQKYVVVGNKSRYTEELLKDQRAGSIGAYVRSVGEDGEPALLSHHVEQEFEKAMQDYRANAIRFLALVEIFNRGRAEDDKIKTVNPAHSKVLSTIENLDQRVADQVKLYDAEIAAGWWLIDDITRAGMLENLFDDDASSPWLVCGLLLTGYPRSGDTGWLGRGKLPSKAAIKKISTKAGQGIEAQSTSTGNKGRKRRRTEAEKLGL